MRGRALRLPTGRKHFRSLAGTERKRYVRMAVIRQLVELSENMCAYCLCQLNGDFHVEHVLPLAFGGTNNLSNLVLSCKRCNLLAGSLVFDTFPAKRSYVLRRRQETS